ncbi:MAG: phytanoyl-CoA dioxygenase family protein, partial [Bacteroidia bacterium]|nr:phytanoyl-CoA dioxygenase family protein [Bacteroidia bacterium]
MGYTVLNEILDESFLAEARRRLDRVYDLQKSSFGEGNLDKINEKNMARAPLVYDDWFLDIATNETVINLVREFLGEYFILHLQNGIINTPDEVHHQTSWHRDLPYQNFVISQPIAISALFCIDEFNEQTGGTFVLPYTHKVDYFPSLEYVEKHQVQVIAPAGSVIVFDSMLFHRAGANRSQTIRRAINNVYVTPILKQQINITQCFPNPDRLDGWTRRFLGFDSDVPSSVDQWRQIRMSRLTSN